MSTKSEFDDDVPEQKARGKKHGKRRDGKPLAYPNVYYYTECVASCCAERAFASHRITQIMICRWDSVFHVPIFKWQVCVSPYAACCARTTGRPSASFKSVLDTSRVYLFIFLNNKSTCNRTRVSFIRAPGGRILSLSLKK